ncbi:MAG: hypothetical protein DI551_00710 [Micavibrio aeruginosavorus]|uniref:Terminase n=1 Tax=Micavibrio aeruginosavorus TaxID=349221 RepID=A0A2W5N710_9BACT|nr:MAG: hypothetical protein DI551_00710 [Micavibrio aeruginosavorus]
MNLNFIPPGPVAAAFMDCRLPVKFIMGPVGSGKTSCMMMDTIYDAARQPRSKIDGVRYSAALFVRETFRQLYSTTIPSWWKWMPKSAGDWKGGGNEAASHHLRFQLPDQSIVDLKVMFEALGDQNVESLFKGKEFNLLRLNEADTLTPEVLSQGIVRIRQGRYPGEMHVDPAACVKNVAGDYNAPDIENYLYKLLEENKPDNYGFFKQPGGMRSDAENRARATFEDYQEMERDLIAQGRPDLARRNIHNLYGYSRDGKPVYEKEYQDDIHCAGVELMPVKDLPVRCDFDQGLRPAVTLRQNMPDGQRRILDELFCDSGAVGLTDELKRLRASDKYRDCRVIGGLADPAANARDANDAESWIDCVNRLMGWAGNDRVRIAPTNDPDKRQAAVRAALLRNAGGGKPGLLISSTCRVARKGFNSTYKFKSKTGKRGEYSDQADKVFPVSDVHDSIQYGALDHGGYEDVVGREKRKTSGFGMRVAKVEVSI